MIFNLLEMVLQCAYTYTNDPEGFNDKGFRCQKDEGDLSGTRCKECKLWFCGLHEEILDGRGICIHCRIDREPEKDVKFHCSFRDRDGDRCENKVKFNEAYHFSLECEEFRKNKCCNYTGEWNNLTQVYDPNHYNYYSGWEQCEKCNAPFCEDHSDFLRAFRCIYCYFE